MLNASFAGSLTGIVKPLHVMEAYQAFPLVLALGAAVCGMTWFLCRRLIHDSWRWRAAFCILVGATVAPTCFRFWGDWVVWPAALMLVMVFDGGKNAALALIYGAPPILLVAGLVFAVWSGTICRKREQEKHLV